MDLNKALKLKRSHEKLTQALCLKYIQTEEYQFLKDELTKAIDYLVNKHWGGKTPYWNFDRDVTDFMECLEKDSKPYEFYFVVALHYKSADQDCFYELAGYKMFNGDYLTETEFEGGKQYDMP